MAGSGGGGNEPHMAGFHDKNSRVVGGWKIIECVSLSGSSEATGIEGTEFVLSEVGDVTWSVTDGCDALPLFSCQMYEVYTYQNLQCYGNRTLLRFAAYNGHIIEFRLDQPVMSRDLMLLTYDGWFMLQCEKVSTAEVAPDLPYSLLPALSDGYFSDITITSQSSRKFEVHSIVLESSVPGLDYQQLNGLEDATLETILHYLYSCCLPADLSVNTAQNASAATRHLDGFQDFREKCDVFVRNTNLTNRLVCLMQEVEECVEVMVQLFNPNDPAVTSPPHLISILKAALRQMAVGVMKVLELSEEFERCGWRLTQEEQHQVMRYTRSQLPPLLATVVRLLANVRTSLAALNHHTRQQLAQQLVPEISSVLQTVCVDVASLRTSLEHIIQASSTSLESSHSPTHLLAKSLRNDLHLRELQKLRILQENLTSFLNSLVHKREQFEEMGEGARVRGVARIIEHFTEELPILTLRLEDAANALEDMLEWSEFKFVFKGATSKVGSIVERLVEHRSVVEALMMELVERVGHPAFTNSLQHLGLLPPAHQPPSPNSHPSVTTPAQSQPIHITTNNQDISGVCSSDSQTPSEAEGAIDSKSQRNDGGLQRVNTTSQSGSNTSQDSGSDRPPQASSHKLNLVRRVCDPPQSRVNPLAKNVGQLLHSISTTDMTFIVVPPAEDESSPTSSQEDLNISEGGPTTTHCEQATTQGAQTISERTHSTTSTTIQGSHTQETQATIHGAHSTKESTPELVDPQPGSIMAPLLKMSSTVRKVKKSLSLDRPSVRTTIPSQAHSLDCDVLMHQDCTSANGNVLSGKHSLAGEVGTSLISRKNVKCNENDRINVCDIGVMSGEHENDDSNAKCKPVDSDKLETLAQIACDKSNIDLDPACKLRDCASLSEDCVKKEFGSNDPCECRNIENNLMRHFNSDKCDHFGFGNERFPEQGQLGKKKEIKEKQLKDVKDSKRNNDAEKHIEKTSDISERPRLCKSKNFEKGNLDYSDSLESQEGELLPITCSVLEEEIGKLSLDQTEIKEEELRDESSIQREKGGKMSESHEDLGDVTLRMTTAIRSEQGFEGVELRAHRVVVAARCEWFRRALLSGMREAIDRCIVVHGCSVETFEQLLRFLYTGHVDCSTLPPDQLVDLLVLADHYGVDALKCVVECGLEHHVDEDSVVPLLTVAHHCNAAHLKDVCIHHCVVSSVVLEGEVLAQLPEDLRQQLNMALGKHRKWGGGSIGEDILVGGDGQAGEDSPLSVSSTDPLLDDQVSLIPGIQGSLGSGESVDSGSGVGSRLEAVVQQLREVVGQHVPRSTLVQITLAADYDLNRALNFFFASSS